MSYIRVTWDMVEQFVEAVRKEYTGVRLDGVYGLPRGGLIFAVMLSHKLNIPLLSSPTKHSLVVDDICDSGESLLHYYKNSSDPECIERTQICTMFYKENKLGVVPDYWMYQKENDWIVFPWEE